MFQKHYDGLKPVIESVDAGSATRCVQTCVIPSREVTSVSSPVVDLNQYKLSRSQELARHRAARIQRESARLYARTDTPADRQSLSAQELALLYMMAMENMSMIEAAAVLERRLDTTRPDLPHHPILHVVPSPK
jgi:hypothetical protein